MKPTLNLAYYTGVPNAGDLANADLVSALTQARVIQAQDLSRRHLMAIGSVLSSARPNSCIWGSGLMHPDFGLGSASVDNILAVRGKLTASALKNELSSLADIPLGDPAILLPQLLGVWPQSVSSGPIGLCPHYTDRRHPTVQRLFADADVIDLDVHGADLSDFLRKMASCSCVISSSLHGLVFAESLGIPNLWVQIGGDVSGDGFKFRDWYSTMARSQDAAYVLPADATARSLQLLAELHDSQIDLAALRAAFPLADADGGGFDVPWISLGEVIPHALCRSSPLPVFIDCGQYAEMCNLTSQEVQSCTSDGARFVLVSGAACSGIDDLGQENSGNLFSNRAPYPGSFDRSVLTDFYLNWAEPQRYAVAQEAFNTASLGKIQALDAALNENPRANRAVGLNAGARAITLHRAGLFHFEDFELSVDL